MKLSSQLRISCQDLPDALDEASSTTKGRGRAEFFLASGSSLPMWPLVCGKVYCCVRGGFHNRFQSVF